MELRVEPVGKSALSLASGLVGRFQFLQEFHGRVLLEYQGRMIQANIKDKINLPPPGSWIVARVDKVGDSTVLKILETGSGEPPGTIAKKTDLPDELVGVVASLLHPDDSMHIDLDPSFFLVPGFLPHREKKKRGSLLSGEGRTDKVPAYLKLQIHLPNLGTIGLLFYSKHFDFSEPTVLLTASDGRVCDFLSHRLSDMNELKGILHQVLKIGSPLVDRSV